MSSIDDPKFPVFSASSVKIYAESGGIDEVPSDVAENLAEDVSYRIREIISKGCQFMKNSKRKQFRSIDLNRAMYWSKVPTISGEMKNSAEFQKVGDVYAFNDDVVNLKEALGFNLSPKAPNLTRLSTDWLLNQDKINDVTNSNEEIPEVHSSYFIAIVECILSDDPLLMKDALKDLRTNPRVSHVLPYLINFFTGAEIISHDLTKLTALLFIIQALLQNQTIYLLLYLEPLLSNVKHCVLEPLTASINPLNDHWLLRDYGARVISKIMFSTPSATNLLLKNLKELLKDTWLNPIRPLFSHYGALVTMSAIGVEESKLILLPYFEKYVTHYLKPLMDDLTLANTHSKEDAHRVFGALLHCMGKLFAYFACSTDNVSEYLNLNFTTALFQIFGTAILQYLPYKENCSYFHHADVRSTMKGFPVYNVSTQKPKIKLLTKNVFDLHEVKHFMSPKREFFIHFGKQNSPKRNFPTIRLANYKTFGRVDPWHRKPQQSRRNLNGATLLSWI